MRFVDWIWHVRGSVELAPGQSSEEAFERLDPFFQQRGTSYERAGDTLTFAKTGQASQDKMAIYDGGTLRVEREAAGSVLRYHLTSRALLACFLAPLLFLAIAQFTIWVVGPQVDAKAASAKDAKGAKPEEAKKPPVVVPLNPIDKFLGAPAPEKPKDGAEKGGRRGKKPSATPAYVFAGIFAALYVIGRILEDRLIKRRFRKKLLGA